MSSGGVFSQTLQSITTAKLTELSKKRTFFENQKSSLLDAARAEPYQQKKLRILLEGVKKCFAIKTATGKRGTRYGGAGQIIRGSTKDPRLEVLLKNLERFLAQAKYDPSVSSKLLMDWERSLLQELNVQSLKYQYATLYGELVTEWLSSEQVSKVTADDQMDEDTFEEVPRESEAKDEGRAQWERLVFEPFETDQKAIAMYLANLFRQNGSTAKALYALHKNVEAFESNLSAPVQFNEEVLKWTINGLLASGLLSDEKMAALKDFLMSQVILTEVADVLNMRMAAVDSWNWDLEGLPVEQRRHVNGKHHIYIEEDLLQAIFLQYIGVKWSVFFKEAFTNFSNSEGAWNSLRLPMSPNERIRRDWYLGKQQKRPSVQAKRQGLYKSIYFLAQLPNDEYGNQSSLVEGEEEVDYEVRPAKRARQSASASTSYQQPPAQMHTQFQMMPGQMVGPTQGGSAQHLLSSLRARRSAPPQDFNAEYDMEDEDNIPKSPMAAKQFLLHLLSTEILVNTRLHGEFTCVHSEFDSWNPSLPHSTILAVLSFFGLSGRWLRFFRNFLAAPLKFTEDGRSAATRLRKRGVPGAHALSEVCGESVLFCLDYAINQRTHGAVQLYRMNDDFWIWSPVHFTVVKGWETVSEFNNVMGVSINKAKTGTVRIVGGKKAVDANQESPDAINPILPEGEIRWGFLVLDPGSGKFVIDQDMVDKHISELQNQLQGKQSIFSWIKAWNTYAGRFFTSNFGKPANCFGREHVDCMLKALERIQRTIFSDTSVAEYLKTTIKERFGISDIPDGYLYFPARLGGLELLNPFIGLVQLRDSVYEHPESALDDFLEAEKEAYRLAKITFDNGMVYRPNDQPRPVTLKGEIENINEFFSFEEFARNREEFYASYTGNLYSVFEELLQQPTAETVDVNDSDNMMLKSYESLNGDYWRWVAQIYGPDMIERFRGLDIVDPNVLPMGMVNLFREGKVKWQG